MTQTTDALSMKDCSIEISINASTWTDISGYTNRISPGGKTREAGEAHTFDGETPIVKGGKMGGIDVSATIVYTEDANSPWDDLNGYMDAGTPLYIRWSPKGGDATEFMITSGAGIITSLGMPGGESQSGDPVVVDFTVRVPSLTKSVVSA